MNAERCAAVTRVRLEPIGCGGQVSVSLHIWEKCWCQEGLEKGDPGAQAIIIAELRKKWRPEAAWWCTVHPGTFGNTPGPGRRDRKAWWWRGHDCGAHWGLGWHGSSRAAFSRGWNGCAGEWLPSPTSHQSPEAQCLQVSVGFKSGEHEFPPWAVVETAKLIRQSMKDSVWMGIDHRAGVVRCCFFFKWSNNYW